MPLSTYGKKIGIMGGTFDPIHYGHLMLAEQIRTSFFLDEIVFIPVGIPPHKPSSFCADKYDRLKMTQLATESNPYFKVSDIEVKRDDVTYTVDTISAIKNTLSEKDTLFFITGADAIVTLESWKDYDALVKNIQFIGATRPGIDIDFLNQKIDMLKKQHGAHIELCYIPALAISSTDIRRRVNDEKSIKYLLPESVEAYIDSHDLYKSHHPRYHHIKEHLSKTLSPKRYLHCLQTARLSRQLASKYRVDPIIAEMAGLCHDIAKEFKPALMQHYINLANIEKDPCIKANINIAHGEVGAYILEHEHGITDQDILNAVRWHTYGCENMNLLCKIVYIADVAEPSHTYHGVDHLRHLLSESIDKAILAYYDMTHQYLSEAKMPIHKNTKKMIEQLKG